MNIRWDKTETVLSAAAILVGAGLWLGVLTNSVSANADDIAAVKADVKEVPAQIAVVQTDVKNLKATLETMRQEQREAQKELIETIRGHRGN